MTDKTPNPANKKKDTRVKDHTQKLDKAMEDISQGRNVDGTLVEIQAHTGEHPALQPQQPRQPGKPARAEPSVSESLKKARRRAPGTPDIEPAATMYSPTKPGQVRAGSDMATQHGPTGGASPSQTPSASGGRGPVAPFGGKIMVGTRVGQIEVTGVLGKGGMGEVFKGYHHALDINVAVKVLPDELSRNELVRQRFLREARLCVKLDHPHIVRVFNVDEYAGNLYLVMEMVEGTDAANMLKNGGRFKYKRALEIGAASADALAYAHSQGLVHRDVKPHNILLGRDDGKIKLSDFGLARAATSSSHLTMSGQIMGTPHYMSPEQAEAKEVTDKSDVYSLGVTLYHMLTGETPFVGDTPISVAVQHIAKEILFPEARFTPFPKELVAVLKRMTSKDQAKRCSAKQAAVWLRKLGDMASDDIQAPPEIGNSLAPVVRESAAFEAAAKEREQHDENAREAARTMLATVREPKAPTAEVAALQQPGGSSQVVVVRDSGGAAKWVALLVLTLVVGGAAAWYFVLGGQDYIRTQGWLAGTGGPPVNNSPGGNSGTANNGNNSGTIGTPPANNPGDNSGPIDPPPAQDDPAIKRRLQDLEATLASASTASELEVARTKLAQIKLNESQASEAQRREIARLESNYEAQHALLNSVELFKRMNEGVDVYETNKRGDAKAAIEGLNRALTADEEFKKLNIPAEVETQIKTDKEATLGRLVRATQEIEGKLRSEISELLAGEAPDYEAADAKLEMLASIRLPGDVRASVREQRNEVRTQSLLKRARDEIRNKTYKTAKDTLQDILRMGVPASLSDRFRDANDELTTQVAAAFDGFLSAAEKAVGQNDYVAARASLEKADTLSREKLLDTPQTEKLVIAKFSTDIRACLFLGEGALSRLEFNEADKQLKEIDRLVREAGRAEGRDTGAVRIPQQLLDAAEQLKQRFDTQLEGHFAGLLEKAGQLLGEKNFSDGSQVLVDAADLPLTKDQQDRLDEFNRQSESALAEYVRSLVAEIEQALNANEFDKAMVALKKTEALTVPDDLRGKLSELDTRFKVEAVKRLRDLLADAEAAIRSKRYEDARKQLASAGKIPVSDEELITRRTATEKSWLDTLTADVEERLGRVASLTDEEKFKEARTTLDAAVPLARLDSSLAISLRNSREELDRRIAAKFGDFLARANDACDSDDFKLADERLAQAAAMASESLLSNEQVIELSKAQDSRNSKLGAYLSRLFKELEGHAKQGQEQAGNAVVEKIQEWAHTLDASGQANLNRLKGELEGEPRDARRDRLPDRWRMYFDDRYTKLEQVIELRESITSLFSSPDGKFGIAGTASGKVHFFNLKRGTSPSPSSGGTRPITAVAYSQDGTVAASGNDSGLLVLYTFVGGAPQPQSLATIDYSVQSMVFSPDGKVLFVVDRDGTLHRYNPVARSRIGSFPTGISRPNSIAISPDGSLVAIGGRDSKVAVFDAINLTLKRTVTAPGDDHIQRVAFSADGSYMIAGSNGNGVGLWDTRNLGEKAIRQFKDLGEWTRGIGITPDKAAAVGFDSEKGLMVWDLEHGTERRSLLFSQFRDSNDNMRVEAGFIAADGTALVGTRSGRLLHFTLGSGK